MHPIGCVLQIQGCKPSINAALVSESLINSLIGKTNRVFRQAMFFERPYNMGHKSLLHVLDVRRFNRNDSWSLERLGNKDYSDGWLLANPKVFDVSGTRGTSLSEPGCFPVIREAVQV
jgi:hypothetical protein